MKNTKVEEVPNLNIDVLVDVPRIVKYCGVTAVLIVSIIFGLIHVSRWVEKGYLKL